MLLKSDFANVNGTRLYYEIAGVGHPLVFIHGFTLDTRMWDDQFEVFAQHDQVVRYDVRGFGKSDVPDGALYSHADDLKALLEHLDIARAHVVGLSMGGNIALDFALAYPAMVKVLVAVDAALGGHRWAAEWDASLTPIWTAGRAGDVATAKRLWLDHALFAPAHENAEVGARLAQIVADYSGWHWVNHNPAVSMTPPAVERLGAIHAPTLAIVGERDLSDFHAIADLVVQQVPNARKVVIPRVGHMSPMEDPASLNSTLLNFLAEP